MATTKEDLREWLLAGKEKGEKYMLVYCDTFDNTDYPIYAKDCIEFWEIYGEKTFTGKDMKRLMEVYDLSLDIETQLKEARAYHLPSKY
jgi:hypothetical protein